MKLISLNIIETRDRPNSYESFSDVAGSDCLESLEEFSYSIDYFHKLGCRLQNVKTLHILVKDEKKIEGISKEIREKEENNDRFLPSLQIVCVKYTKGFTGKQNRLFQIDGVRNLAELNVSCYLAVSSEPPFTSRMCLCQKAAVFEL